MINDLANQASAIRVGFGAGAVLAESFGRWLPFLDTYRTMCIAPDPEFQRLLQRIDHQAPAA